MEPWAIALGVAALGALLWWMFRPSGKAAAEPKAKRSTPGAVTRLAERGLEAIPLGLKVSPRDDDVIGRFDFPPFGRGEDRAATEVIKGEIDGVEVLAFRYSFALAPDEPRREYDITMIAVPFGWVGRLRLSSLPRPADAEVSFEQVWRVDEEPPGTDLVTERLASVLMQERLKAAAVVATDDALVLIDSVRRAVPSLAEDLEALKQIRGALRSV